MDCEIICFNHCGKKIFCFKLPEFCPKCVKSTNNLKEIPFRIPYPFVRASHHPCSVVMKSTDGKLLDDYKNFNNLHIGVTDSRGRVTEFDTDGIRTENTDNWNQSILIYKISDAWTDYWDESLRIIRNEKHWNSEKYHDIDNNCYDFVLEFLRRLKCEELKEYVGGKEEFCEKFVVPNTSVVGSYISMYRKIREEGYFIQNT